MKRLSILLIIITLPIASVIYARGVVSSGSQAAATYAMTPSGDITGITDTLTLQSLIDAGVCRPCNLAPGKYYFARNGSLAMLNLSPAGDPDRNAVTINGAGRNATALYMVGENSNPSED